MKVAFLQRKVMVRLLALSLFGHVLMAAPCVEDSLQNYVNLGAPGCTIGSVQFSNFLLGTVVYPELDPSLVRLVPTFNPGFLVTLNASVGAGEIVESAFSFSATGMQFGQAGVGLIGSAVAGDGVNTALGIFTPGGPVIAYDLGFDALLFDSIVFPAEGAILAELEFVADGGLTGSASLAQGEVSFGEGVPEPSAWMLMGSGAIGLIGLHLRRSIRRGKSEGGKA